MILVIDEVFLLNLITFPHIYLKYFYKYLDYTFYLAFDDVNEIRIIYIIATNIAIIIIC